MTLGDPTGAARFHHFAVGPPGGLLASARVCIMAHASASRNKSAAWYCGDYQTEADESKFGYPRM
jgi:hypothetical protein